MTNYRLKKWFDFGIILTVFFAMFAISTMAVTTWDGSVEWTRQGTDSEHCEYVGQEGRTADGWMHWIFNQAGDVTDAELRLGGSGFGTYAPTKVLSKVYHFMTPYFDIDELEATIFYKGTHDGNFVLSDYCPGTEKEELTVSKTVNTTFNRTHDWSIAKSVDKDAFYLFVDGSGDGKATWKVDVTYLGFVDADHNVSGTIKIENTGDLDATITKIEDVLDGTPIDVDCGEITFPYLLVKDATLSCTYDEDGEFMNDNVVTVTTERDVYSDTKAVVWGDPENDVHATVVVKDQSDLFGLATLGTLDAYDYDKGDIEKFTYDKMFAWEDYGKDLCGAEEYGNTATVYGDDDVVLGYSTANVKVYIQCFVYETAFAKGENSRCFLEDGFSRWGWTNKITVPGYYEMPLIAGAGQCMGGTVVGTVKVSFIGNLIVVNYELDAMYDLDETHVYAGKGMYPLVKVGRRMVETVAPGQYYIEKSLYGDIYVIAHAVVGLPDPSFGP
ncbi:MAG: hypothetical protein CVU85_00055 [Firmicutes bacterium HGW-Firmicutes-10]|jgi:hypothetical protein|nr:MAG: hypothetical protein CVU85_00055 [Firmicutes bacterium HGW-Firmicutes-10]